MKTIITTLPIYDRLEKQINSRAEKAKTGHGTVAITCPRHRLPSFMYNYESDNPGAIDNIYLVDEDGTETSIIGYFWNTYYPTLLNDFTITTGSHISYAGDRLYGILPCGVYYLKIVHEQGNIYYSEWFRVEDINTNILYEYQDGESHATDFWAADSYNTFTTTGAAVTSAVNTSGAAVLAWTTHFEVAKGRLETLYLSVYLVLVSGEAPSVQLINDSGASSLIYPMTNGVNLIPIVNLTQYDDYARLKFTNSTNCNWFTTDFVLMRDYSPDYTTINFSNNCDLGDVIYSESFAQSLWLKLQPMQVEFPIEEEGQKNGYGQFVRTFGRQVKRYTIDTATMPDYMVDVFNRMKLCDTVTLIDLVGDSHSVYNLDITHEWLWDDRFFARITLTFDYNEAVVVSACCTL